MTRTELARLRETLLSWYDEHARDLPWRQRSGAGVDPYMVWVSEVMLQQTRVETVRPFFERWLKEFPDLESLATASQDQVLRAWEGLGYYSRARNLHAAVREVVMRYGAVPSDPEALRSLPGIGRYTAGAIASIAFGREAPVVDGNVKRVFARLLDRGEPTDAELWDLAGRLVVGERPGDLNQALMELGATVCLPKSPGCHSCPINGFCDALARGTVDRRPSPKRRGALPIEHHGVATIRRNGTYLLVRRPEDSRLGGMWGFPEDCQEEGEEITATACRAIPQLFKGSIRELRPLGQFSQVFTHVKVVYSVFEGRVEGEWREEPADAGRTWAALDELGRYAMPRAQRRIASLLEDRPPPGSVAS